MHQHLVDLSHLACSSYDELVKHRSGYEQAYLLECRKLQQNVDDFVIEHDIFNPGLLSRG